MPVHIITDSQRHPPALKRSTPYSLTGIRSNRLTSPEHNVAREGLSRQMVKLRLPLDIAPITEEIQIHFLDMAVHRLISSSFGNRSKESMQIGLALKIPSSNSYPIDLVSVRLVPLRLRSPYATGYHRLHTDLLGADKADPVLSLSHRWRCSRRKTRTLLPRRPHRQQKSKITIFGTNLRLTISKTPPSEYSGAHQRVPVNMEILVFPVMLILPFVFPPLEHLTAPFFICFSPHCAFTILL